MKTLEIAKELQALAMKHGVEIVSVAFDHKEKATASFISGSDPNPDSVIVSKRDAADLSWLLTNSIRIINDCLSTLAGGAKLVRPS